jgi:hypothetical protein
LRSLTLTALITLLALAALLLPGCGGSSGGGGPFTITGFVEDGASLAAVSGGTVSAQGHQTTTSSDGFFTLANVPQNPVTLSVTAPGYAQLVTVVQVPGAAQSVGTLYLAPVHVGGTGQVTGTVTVGGVAAAGAMILGGGSQSTSNDQGQFNLYNVTAGVQNLTVASADRADMAVAAVTVVADTTVSAGYIALSVGPPPVPLSKK